MADGTAIEWADATINAISGCLPASPGCTNCFASTAGQRRRPNHPVNGLTRPAKADDPASRHVWTGAIRLNEEWLVKPLRWSRPRRIFWNAHGDPFFERVPYEWVDRELAVAALTPHHIHMLLTKRTARMRRYFAMSGTPERILEAAKALPAPFGRLPDRWQWPLPNVWLGVSVEDQLRADERREDVRHTPAAVKFVSYEPALGPVDWSGWEFVDQIIGGGESGLNARPAHPAWFRSTRDWCAQNDVAYFHKQNGEFVATPAPNARWKDGTPVPADLEPVIFTRIGKRRAGRLLDGVEHNAFPEPRHDL